MKFGNFKEGIDIMAKYVKPDAFAMCALHDKFLIGPDLTDDEDGVISAEDVARLKELGWFVDEESWACFT